MTEALQSPAPSIRDIQHAASLICQVSVNDMCSHRRNLRIVRTRQMAMTLAKELTPHSLPTIGKRFGGFDHTTVLHSVRRVEDARQSGDLVFLRPLAAMRATLGLHTDRDDPEISAFHDAAVARVMNRLTARLAAGDDGDPELEAFTAAVVDRLVERVTDRVVRRIEKTAPQPLATTPLRNAVRKTVDAAATLQRDDWSPGRRSAQAALDRNLNELREIYETL